MAPWRCVHIVAGSPGRGQGAGAADHVHGPAGCVHRLAASSSVALEGLP
jgi:hypothetical protein